MLTLQIGLTEETCEALSDAGFSVIATDPIECEEDVLACQDYHTPSIIVAELYQAPWTISATRAMRKRGIQAPIVGIYSGPAEGNDHHSWWCRLQEDFLRIGITSVLRGPVPVSLVVAAAHVPCRLISGSTSALRSYLVQGANLEFDDETGIAHVNGKRIQFTEQEARFFRELLENMGKPQTKEGLLNALYFDRPDADRPGDKLVDVVVCHVRKKLRNAHPALEGLIETVWARGYIIQRLRAADDAKIVRPEFGRKIA